MGSNGQEGEAGSRAKLTDKIVKAIEAPPADWPRPAVIVWDSEVRGFGIRVTRATADRPEGVRAFVLSYRTRGKGEKREGAGVQRTYTLGRFPDDYRGVSPARKAAQVLRQQIAEGADPMAEVHEHRAAPTVDELADSFIKDHAKPHKRPSSVKEDEDMLKQWIRPRLGAKKVRDVTHEQVAALHAEITAAGTPFRANRVLSLLHTMFRFAIKAKMRTDNPAADIERNPERSRERFLEDDEVMRLVAALDKRSEDQDAPRAIKLLLLSGARRGEVLNAEWSQFNLKKGQWTKPASMTKQKKEHQVKINAAAQAIVAAMRADADAGEETALALEGKAKAEKHPKRRQALLNAATRARARQKSPYLFPGRKDGSALKGVRVLWRRVLKEAKLEGVRLHDLRHSFASHLVSAGYDLPVIGKMLGHAQVQTTARYAHLKEDVQSAAAEVMGKLVTGAESANPSAEVKQFPAKGRKR